MGVGTPKGLVVGQNFLGELLSEFIGAWDEPELEDGDDQDSVGVVESTDSTFAFGGLSEVSGFTDPE